MVAQGRSERYGSAIFPVEKWNNATLRLQWLQEQRTLSKVGTVLWNTGYFSKSSLNIMDCYERTWKDMQMQLTLF